MENYIVRLGYIITKKCLRARNASVIIVRRFMPPKKYMEVSLHTVPTTPLVANPEKEELKA